METKPEPKKSPVKKIIAILIIVLVLIFVGLFFLFNIVDDSGAQAGVLIKISQKGVLMKTYEGELNTGGMNTVPNTAQANQIWTFSVRDPAVADTLMRLGGRKVNLHYNKILKAMPWQGETNYFVTGVDVIN